MNFEKGWAFWQIVTHWILPTWELTDPHLEGMFESMVFRTSSFGTVSFLALHIQIPCEDRCLNPQTSSQKAFFRVPNTDPHQVFPGFSMCREFYALFFLDIRRLHMEQLQESQGNILSSRRFMTGSFVSWAIHGSLLGGWAPT